MDDPELNALFAEFRRLGLNPADLPGLAIGLGNHRTLLRHLQALRPGATWHEALPDLPKHWVPGKPETWTTPYRPFGPYDYQELPTGPAVHVTWSKPGQPGHLERLMAAAKEAAWPVYGAGLIDVASPGSPTIDAMIVLRTGTDTGDLLFDFTTWLEQHGVTVAAVPRLGTEEHEAIDH